MPLITAAQITFLTIVIGPIIAGSVVLYGLCRCRERVSSDFVIVMVSNGISLVPILCLIYNLVIRTYAKSWPGAEADFDAKLASIAKLTRPVEPNVASFMEGSETTIFLALMYAAILIFVSIYRNIASPR